MFNRKSVLLVITVIAIFLVISALLNTVPLEAEAAAFALRINSGGDTVVDGATTWEDDAPYVSGGSDFNFGSSSIDTTTNSIAAPVPPLDVFNTVRHGDHTFDIPSVPNGSYTVRIIWTDKETGTDIRRMDYYIEGVLVLEDFDLPAEAGGQFIAVEREFEVTVSDGNGMQIEALKDTGNDVFESAIEIVSLEGTTPTAPTITSTAVTDATEGIAYSYDVEATGIPAPAFSLLVSPAGMTIDTNSGLIEWSSPTLGDHDVEVQALNSEGSDTQDFVLSVTEAAAFALRINSGGDTVVDGATTWEDDAPYVSGGSDYTFSTSSVDTATHGIVAPIPPLEVLKTVRHGDHTFDIMSVPNGSYTVRIIWTDQETGTDKRLMDYYIEGVLVLEDFDLPAEAGGQFIAVERDFEVTVSDGNGMQIEALKDTGNDVFESAIEIVSLEGTTPTAPTITSTAVTDATEGIAYSYDVAATGNPAPAFSLLVSPAGMTIDTNSGLIEWSSPTLGDHDVEVQALNSEGSDTQDFVLSVTEAAAFALRINSGGDTVVDGATTWEDDAPYVSGGSDFNFGSSSIDTTTNSIAAPVPPLDVFNTVRHGDHTFDIPSVPNGSYTVRIIWTDKETGTDIRRMDYYIEGVLVLEDFDLPAEAGGQFIAVEREFEVTVSDGNGMQIEALKDTGNDVFESAIEIVSLEGTTPTAPTITSTAVTDATEGIAYSYDVEATGIPAPAFSLLVSPAGMTIDTNSGLIEWSSPTLGDHDVEVQALNSEGSDTQDFVLSVTEAAAFALRINSGGDTVVDGATTWEDDAPYVSGGSDYTFSTSSVDTATHGIVAPIPPLEVLKTVRHGDHTFDITSVPNGSYTVRIIWTDQETGTDKRLMDYYIEGVLVLEDFDLPAEAGGQFIAVERDFEVTVSDGNGMQIEALKDTGNDVFESAIEIVSLEGTGILGDVNGDDTVNSTDALIVLSCDAGIDTSGFCPCDCGDVNADTVVNSTDALIILSYDAGLTVPYPVGEPGCPSGVTPCPGCNP